MTSSAEKWERTSIIFPQGSLKANICRGGAFENSLQKDTFQVMANSVSVPKLPTKRTAGRKLDVGVENACTERERLIDR